jgi:hypothetical protein
MRPIISIKKNGFMYFMDDCITKHIDKLRAEIRRLINSLFQIKSQNNRFRLDLDKKVPLYLALYQPNTKQLTINHSCRINIYDNFAIKSLFHIFLVVHNYSNMGKKVRRIRLKADGGGD